MEPRAGSPTPSSSCQDFRAPARRSAASYRLFPVVESTPPASPVALRRKASPNPVPGAVRRDGRRSSSVERKTSKETTIVGSIGTNGIAAPKKHPVSTFRESRKASLPEFQPLRAVRELEHDTTELSPSPRFIEYNRAQSQDRNGPRESVLGHKGVSASSTTYASPQQMSSGPRASNVPIVHPKRVDSLSLSSLAQQPRARRSKPNLRVAVGLRAQGQQPPSPPAKSPRHLCSEAEQKGTDADARHSTETPRTPDQAQTSIAHQECFVPIGTEVKVRELTLTPPAARGSSQSTWPKMHIFPKERTYGQPRSPTLLSSRSSSTTPALRPNTAGEPVARSPQRTLESHQGRPTISRPLEARSGLLPPPTPSKESLRPYKSTENLRYTEQTEALNQNRRLETSRGHYSRAFVHDDNMTIAPTPSSPAPSTADDTESIASAIRKHAAGTADRKAARDDPTAGSSTNATPTSEPFSRLALARANVAALRNSDASSHNLDEGRASGFELGALNRAFTAEALSRRASGPGTADPVQALQDLSSQVEALHARYSNLKTERQRISAGLVERLKIQQPSSDFASILINDQLSLAAVSSSMDICFAKLKSLECRKEDAISALIAQATQTKRSPSDNIASMVASMAAVSRKSSLAPSAETDSHYAATGRSTPDLGESFSTKRSTQSSLSRTLSYTSEPSSQSYRLSELSRKSSFRLDVARLSDPAQKQTPATIEEVAESPKRDTITPKRTAALDYEPSSLYNEVGGCKSLDAGGEQDGPEDVSSSEDSSLEELLETTRRPRANGMKAAKVLGIPDEVLVSKDVGGPKAFEEPLTLRALRQQEAQNDADLHSLIPGSSEKAPSLLTTLSKVNNGSSEVLDSPAIHDLEAELQNFPKPSKPTLATVRSLPALPTTLPGPLSMNPPTPAEPPPDWEEAKRFRHDSATLSRMPSYKDNRPKRTMTTASTRTTHTINVYLEQPAHEDFMEFY